MGKKEIENMNQDLFKNNLIFLIFYVISMKPHIFFS